MKIDLGKKTGSTSLEAPASDKKEPKVYYPTLYLRDIEECAQLPDGEFSFRGRARVVSLTESKRDGKKTCSCELEILEISNFGGELKKKKDLDDDLDEIEGKKSEDYTD